MIVRFALSLAPKTVDPDFAYSVHSAAILFIGLFCYMILHLKTLRRVAVSDFYVKAIRRKSKNF